VPAIYPELKAKKGPSKFFDESSEVWDERVVIIYDYKTKRPICAEYDFFRANPILREGDKCVDKYEIDKALKREGWSVGMGGLTYKENISFSQLPECRAFKEAYQETYESIIEEAKNRLPTSEQHRAIYEDQSYTLSQFFKMVKEKFEELKGKMPRIEIRGTGLQQLREIHQFLRAQGFELYEEVWDEEDQEEV